MNFKEAFVTKTKGRNSVEWKMRRLYLGRDLPREDIETQAVAQMHTMFETGRKWLHDHPQANVTIVFNQIERYIGGIDDGLKRGFVKASPDAIEFLKALWPWEDPCIPTVTMCKVVFDEITRRRA